MNATKYEEREVLDDDYEVTVERYCTICDLPEEAGCNCSFCNCGEPLEDGGCGGLCNSCLMDEIGCRRCNSIDCVCECSTCGMECECPTEEDVDYEEEVSS